jgi:hypothetical protein
MTCQTCDNLLAKCAEALVGAAQPVASFEGPCDAVLFHGGRYSEEAYDHVAAFFQRYPDAVVWIPSLGGTFESKKLQKSKYKTEADLHAAELRARRVKNTIEKDPVATNTAEEIRWAGKKLARAKELCVLTTDVHVLRLSLTYIHAPNLSPTFLRPGVWQADLARDRERILQEVYRILLYGMVDNAKPTEAAQELFFDVVEHERAEHPEEHAALLLEREPYIRDHFDTSDPLLR